MIHATSPRDSRVWGRFDAEQWIKEAKYAVRWPRLSCRDFKDNQARLQLCALAYNLGNLDVPRWVSGQASGLIKIGAKVVPHSRYVVFQMGEVAAPRELFARILERIHGERGRFRLDREASCGRMMIRSPVNGEITWASGKCYYRATDQNRRPGRERTCRNGRSKTE